MILKLAYNRIKFTPVGPFMSLKNSNKLWLTLFSLAPIHQQKPASSPYDVIVDAADLNLVKQFEDGGYDIKSGYMGGADKKAIIQLLQKYNLW